jgi:predicted ATP-grasp superfamily ATP-dependent carboligase
MTLESASALEPRSPERVVLAEASPPAVICGDLNMLRCFVGTTISTLVVASDPNEVTLRSRYCKESRLIAPTSQPEQAVADLEAIGRSYPERPVLYYGSDSMLLLVSNNRERLARFFRFRMPSAELIDATVDKTRFAELAARHELPTPRTVTQAERLDAAEIPERIGFPCLLKPSEHTRWHAARAAGGAPPLKAIRAEDARELEQACEELRRYCDSFIAQQWIRGGDDRIYSYHAWLSEASEPCIYFCGKKIRTYPKDTGVSTYLELVKEPRIAALGAEACRRLGLVGPVKLDFKQDEVTGEFYLLEVNARFTLWNYLGAASGVNLPLIAYMDLTGKRCESPHDYRTDVRWLSFSNDLRAFLRDYHPAGNLSFRQWLGSYRGPKIYDVFSWKDPAPFGASLLQYSRALAARLTRTLGSSS